MFKRYGNRDDDLITSPISRNDDPKDECKVQLEGTEKEWWAGTELGLFRGYQFPGHGTTSDDSVVTGNMGSGFVWLDRSKCGNEHIRHTPDHEDLVTSTDNEVPCRLVVRWVGQMGKTSLTNTTDADILEYILTKLTTRIATKSRTFLVKVKSHRKKS